MNKSNEMWVLDKFPNYNILGGKKYMVLSNYFVKLWFRPIKIYTFY